MNTSTKDNSGKTLWRSVGELEQTSEFNQHLQHEFGDAAEKFPEGVSRRRWLQLMGASLSLSGLAGCRFENEPIRPFAFRPQNRVPGESQQFATTIEWAGGVHPLVATSFDGRPIKLDGNPDHPLSLGASSVFTQGCILSLYDPDRSRGIMTTGSDEASWEGFAKAFEGMQKKWASPAGKGFAVLAAPSTSPVRAAAKDAFLKKFGDAQWFEYESISNDNERLGLKAAFGKPVIAQRDYSKAEIVVCLDADPLYHDSQSTPNIRGWAAARDADNGVMSRAYVIESGFSVTGSNADHRWPMRSRDIAGFAAALSEAVNGGGDSGSGIYEKRLAVIAADLKGRKGASLVVAGANQPPEVHALVAKINADLGNGGKTVSYADDPQGDRPGSIEAITGLAAKMKSGEITSLMVVDCNPAYDAPAELAMKDLIKAADSIHLGMYRDETANFCQWHLNLAHPLEVWGDAIARDGSYCIAQPLILPLFDSKSAAEVLSMLAGDEKSDGLSLVKASAKKSAGGSLNWEQAVQDGFVKESQSKASDLSVSGSAPKVEANNDWKNSGEIGIGDLEVVFTPSHSVFDGRFANNGWLQELPDPITKLTWGNVALMSPATAEAIGVGQGEVVRLRSPDEGKVDVPVFLQPGNAAGSVSIAVGYGRKMAGFVGGSVELKAPSVGVDVAPVRKAAAWNFATGIVALPQGSGEKLAHTQDHHAIDVLGLNAINDRWESLIQIGEFDDYQEFLKKHPIGEAGHDHGDHSGDAVHGDADTGSDGDAADHEPEDRTVLANEDGHSEGKVHGDHGGHSDHWPDMHHHHPPNVDLTPNDEILTAPNQWAMSIDLNKCVGCNACIVACQSENNIPVVGADQVKMGREMQWLRIDRYLASDQKYKNPSLDPEPQIQTQPMTCQHCETAPCETVCPVAATVHSAEGLNDMVYNRCIGTRYCGNNCPFKVRRFNFFNYSEAETFVSYPWAEKRGASAESDRSLQNMVMNPEVTIRSRGVMEKCTFCVQRIQNAKIKVGNEGRGIEDGDIVTACQQVCPAGAIEFGDQNDKDSKVVKAHANPRSYRMLDYLNLRQRTVYLSRVRNEHPEWPMHEVPEDLRVKEKEPERAEA